LNLSRAAGELADNPRSVSLVLANICLKPALDACPDPVAPTIDRDFAHVQRAIVWPVNDADEGCVRQAGDQEAIDAALRLLVQRTGGFVEKEPIWAIEQGRANPKRCCSPPERINDQLSI